ncbi:unnamed protein product [Brachionus calyciflorus]|uniref:Uncharacterized protein n=1 Tax=Brachionus calyciflorus TaxID=104777 RepID=A0A813QYW6_9BILA|nr:unnamed protein product [Brachionus calyciflorus]
MTSSTGINKEQIESEKEKLREEFEAKILELQNQYEEEKVTKEALMKQIDSIKSQYDKQINSLDEKGSGSAKKPKSSKNNRRQSKKPNENGDPGVVLNLELTDSSQNMSEIDPEQRLHKLEEMVVGGEQANNEELKKKRIKNKKYAEERKRLLAESLKKGNDDEFMLRVYDSVQEEVQYKTKLLEKEKEKSKFLQNEVEDLQKEFEKEREEYLDMIRKQERQIKLLNKLNQKIQPLIPNDSNYFNLDKIQMMAIWNEEIQDWIVPELKREKLSLPSMGQTDNDIDLINGQYEYLDASNSSLNSYSKVPSQQVLLQARRQDSYNHFAQTVEPEIDRYRIKLENSQFDGSSYFKNKRQSELLSQTQDLKNNGRLSPINNSKNGSKRFF